MIVLTLAVKLKHHRLKPGGVPRLILLSLAVKLKHDRLKPGGVPRLIVLSLALKLKHHRLKSVVSGMRFHSEQHYLGRHIKTHRNNACPDPSRHEEVMPILYNVTANVTLTIV